MTQAVEDYVEKQEQSKWVLLSNDESVENVIRRHTSLILCKPVQSGKTSDVFKIVEKTYKDTVTIFISDKNVALAGQTNARARVQGFTVFNFNEATRQQQVKLLTDIPKACGKKKIFHFLMEKNNLSLLFAIISSCKAPITLIIDEADKNRNVSDYASDTEDEDGEEVDASETLPIITRRLFTIKNRLKARGDGSRVVFVTATPQSLLVSEHDEDRIVIYKRPYNNYIGAGLDHEPDVEIINAIRFNTVAAGDRWSGNSADRYNNTFRQGVDQGIETFMSMGSKDPTIKQVMLISLESRNSNQNRLADYINNELLTPEEKETLDVVVFNGTNKAVKGFLLSEVIKFSKKRKICIIAGFMAARGVSFTDFSDPENKFELCLQVHNTKQEDPLNSATQAMRIFGPARRTVVRPVMVCNKICTEDLKYNFVEAYRVIRDLAMGQTEIERGAYDVNRPLTQSYNFRYMLQAGAGRLLLFRSAVEADWLPVNTLGSGL